MWGCDPVLTFISVTVLCTEVMNPLHVLAEHGVSCSSREWMALVEDALLCSSITFSTS